MKKILELSELLQRITPVVVIAILLMGANGSTLVNLSQWNQFARIAGKPFGHTQTTVSATQTFISETTAGYTTNDETTLHLYRWNTSFRGRFATDTYIYVVMDDDATVAIGTGVVTDSVTGNGQGIMEFCPANEWCEIPILREYFPSPGTAVAASVSQRPGYRSSSCTYTSVGTGTQISLVGWPCDGTNDCPNPTGSAGGACTGTSDPIGAFVTVIATTGAAAPYVGEGI
jgi:hypothetical protein